MKITWLHRYSKTMENDKHGRWAIVGYVGNLAEHGKSMEVCWIKKVMDKFYISCKYPTNSEVIFDTVDECKEAAQKQLERFIAICEM